jgi:hypothetical protein
MSRVSSEVATSRFRGFQDPKDALNLIGVFPSSGLRACRWTIEAPAAAAPIASAAMAATQARSRFAERWCVNAARYGAGDNDLVLRGCHGVPSVVDLRD